LKINEASEEEEDYVTTPDEDILINKFLSRSVTVGTARGYMLGIRRWKEYLAFLGKDSNPGQFMEKIKEQHEKAKRMVLFMAYLYMNNGMRDEQIKRVVTSIAYMFEVEGKDASFFDNAIVSRGRKASLRSIEECSAHEIIRAENTILPICLDIVIAVRRQYWEEQGWDAKGMDNKGIWLARDMQKARDEGRCSPFTAGEQIT
jgi:hypothetical protein